MPQYIRENGAIKVIPDDNTTEDGEIELSRKRKIIDEGNIILEGRDDGTTVVREKRPTDHTFFQNVQTYETFEGSDKPSSLNYQTVSVYQPISDVYVTITYGETIIFWDPEDLTSEDYFIKSSEDITQISSSRTDSRIFGTSNESGDVLVFDLNDSTGEYEEKRKISTPNSKIANNILLQGIGYLVVIGDSEVTYINPSNETVIGNDTSTAYSVPFFPFIQRTENYTRPDRLLYPTESGDFKILNVLNQSSVDVSGSTDEITSADYIPKLDLYYSETRSNKIQIYDSKTLEKINEIDGDSYVHENLVLEDRFVLRFDSTVSGSFDLYDPKNLNLLSRINIAQESVASSTQGGAFDSKRNRIFAFLSSRREIWFTVDYNPFYS
jgi:hypothetical protein